MAVISIEPELLKEVDFWAKEQHTSSKNIIHKAIVRVLEDMEDIRAAEYALQHTTSTKILDEVRKELGLEN